MIFWGKWQQVFNSWHVFINIPEQEKMKMWLHIEMGGFIEVGAGRLSKDPFTEELPSEPGHSKRFEWPDMSITVS